MPAPTLSTTAASVVAVGTVRVSGHLISSTVSGNVNAPATCGCVIAPLPGQGLPGTASPTIGGPGCITNQDPTSHKIGATANWTRDFGGLPAGIQYACRAYATNASGGPSYGAVISPVQTWDVPSVALGTLSNVDRDSASCGGNVVRDGGNAVTSRGVVWDLASNPIPSVDANGNAVGTAHKSNAATAGSGTFAANATALNSPPYAYPGVNYRYRAWARNAVGVAHSAGTTAWTTNTTPFVNTPTVDNIGNGTADFHSSCLNGAGSGTGQTITDKGFVWEDALNTGIGPTGASGHFSAGGGAGVYSDFGQQLSAGVSYNVWAYAQNNVGIVYSAAGTAAIPRYLTMSPAVARLHGRATVTTDNAWLLQAYPWNVFNNPRHRINDPAIRFDQKVDSDHPVPHVALSRLVAHTDAFETPVYPLAEDVRVRLTVAALFEATKDYGADIAQRAFHVGSSMLGVEPLLKQPALVDAADGRTHKADNEPVTGGGDGPPPPPPPPPDTAPDPPTRFFVTTGLNSAVMSWNLNTEPDMKSYRIYELESGTWTLIKRVDHPTHGATITGLNSGTAYQFRITAVDTGGLESAPSGIAHVSTHVAGKVVTIPIGGASDTFATTGKFDATGTRDISDELIAWLNNTTNVPNGTGAAQATRVIFPAKQHNGQRAKYRIEGGIQGGIRPQGMIDVAFDGQATAAGNGQDGALIVSTTKRPFVARAGSGNPSSVPTGAWDLVYAPTNVTIDSSTGSPAPYASAQAKVEDQAASNNRIRSIFRPRNQTRWAIRNMQISGSYNRSGFDALYEAQDAITFEGCVDCEVGNVAIDSMWGNGIECTPWIQGSTWTPDLGIWIHDCDIQWFGRQSFSLTHGQRFIIEDTTFGHAHTGLDAEPQSASHNLEGNASVTDIHVLNCMVTDNGSGGGIALHAGVLRVHVAGNTGSRPGFAAECFAEYVIFENNKDTDTSGAQVGPYGSHYGRIAAADNNNATGVDYGGRNLIHRNNTLIAHLGSAKFEPSCDFYSSSGNVTHDTNGQVRGQVPFGDAASSNPPSFSLPVPAHALRDL